MNRILMAQQKRYCKWPFSTNQFVHKMPLSWKRWLRTLFQMSSWSIFKWIWTLFQKYIRHTYCYFVRLLINIAGHGKRKEIVTFFERRIHYISCGWFLSLIHIYDLDNESLKVYIPDLDCAKDIEQREYCVMMHGLRCWR